jgi:hypothetical protein
MEDIEIKEQFEITDDSTAEWALKKVLEAKGERQRLLDLIEYEKDRLDAKKEQVEKKYESNTSYLLSKLGEYFETVTKRKTKTQESYQLLSGKLVRKFAKQKLTPNKEALLQWCKENAPECIKTTEEASWSDIKSKLTIIDGAVVYAETGELVACVTVDEVPPAFDVAE